MNKNELPAAKIKQLHAQFLRVLCEVESKELDRFLQTLLGPEERLMLAKRLAILVMLKEGYSHYRIASTLKVSTTTVHNIEVQQNKNTLTDVNKMFITHKETYSAILEIVDSLLSVGGIMPRRVGLDRYRHL